MQRKDLGIAVIGSGRIGTLRAVMAAAHPAVKFLAVSDRDPQRAEKLAARVGAQLHTSDNFAAISHPDVNAVIVSTIELEHTLPILQALELGKPVLVEKPLALDLAEADKLIAAVAKTRGDLRVGFSRRYKDRYLLAKTRTLVVSAIALVLAALLFGGFYQSVRSALRNRVVLHARVFDYDAIR